MLSASILLLAIGLLGAFDVLYFHHYKARIPWTAATRSEAFAHVAKAPVYAAQFFVVPNMELHGRWLLALVFIYAVDVAVAAWDVAIEPRARASVGGLPAGEYAMHIALSVLVGIYLAEVARAAAPWWHLPDRIVWAGGVPPALRIALGVLGAGALAMGAVELAVLSNIPGRIRTRLRAPRPLHVSVVLETTIPELWTTTQDHLLHPTWDHRFDHIEMLARDNEITTGTEMLYEKRMFGITVRGKGRYKLHKPLKQSTFEFWSDSPLSLIERGVGLWLYREVAPRKVLFSTSYTYRVRWGLFGDLVDRWLFRPLFQRETEKSFRRLAALLGQRAEVHGARGRKPARSIDELREGEAT
ncbi:MAG: SRPBCC family protein [Polyangiaceae bacterium]|nr:SRPBCC family protein [Polyangiaceae bacterium]